MKWWLITLLLLEGAWCYNKCHETCSLNDECKGNPDCPVCRIGVCQPLGECQNWCNDTSDCYGAFCHTCVDNQCVTGCHGACNTDEHCTLLNGTSCPLCVGGLCQAPGCGTLCTASKDCAEMETCKSCIDNRCVAQCGDNCTLNAQCGMPDCGLCVRNQCSAGDVCGRACASSLGCSGNCYACINGFCVKGSECGGPCNQDFDCGNENCSSCVNNKCSGAGSCGASCTSSYQCLLTASDCDICSHENICSIGSECGVSCGSDQDCSDVCPSCKDGLCAVGSQCAGPCDSDHDCIDSDCPACFGGICGQPHLGAFCLDNVCPSPMNLYPEKPMMNFATVANPIPRNTPDGIHSWPYKCAQDNCTSFLYKVLPEVHWWDKFKDQKALPTNMWWTPYFSDPPYETNPAGWTWPTYALPYTTLALENTFCMGWPIAQLVEGRPGVMPDMDVDANKSAPLVQISPIQQMFEFSASEGVGSHRLIEEYDRMGLGVLLSYSQPQVQHKRRSSAGTHSFAPNEDVESTIGPSMMIPVVKGSPFITVLYDALTPEMFVRWGYVHTVNGIQTDKPDSQNTTVMGKQVKNGLYVYDVHLYDNVTHAFSFRIYSALMASVEVRAPHAELPKWSIASLHTCPSGGNCAIRIACSFNEYVDPTYPEPWYSGLPGGKFAVDPAVLDDHAQVYPIVSSSADPDHQTVKFDMPSSSPIIDSFMKWEVACVNAGQGCNPDNLLMLSLPHHRNIMTASNSGGTVTEAATVVYPTMQGVAVGCLGADWVLRYNADETLKGVLDGDPFYSQSKINNDTRKDVLRAQLVKDMNYWTGNVGANHSFVYADCYSFGKLVGAIGRLVLIAEELGEYTIAHQGRTHMKLRLNQWLDRSKSSPTYPFVDDQRLIYDSVWGGMIPLDGVDNPGPFWMGPDTIQPQYGSGGYNDHLFHYGYYIYGAAVILHSNLDADVEWFRGVQPKILALARDIANPDQNADPYFTQFRHHSDWYAGHTWAAGLFPSADYPNVESTSEAYNAWYSVYLLGYAINEAIPSDQATLAGTLMATGRLLLTADLQAFDFYNHMRADQSNPGLNPLYKEIVPEKFSQYGIVGNLWAGQIIFQTFWSWGLCEWKENPDYLPAWCNGRHQLEVDQLRYFNELFIFMIQFLPFTPITTAVATRDWLDASFHTEALVFTNLTGEGRYGYTPVGKADTVPDFYGKCHDKPPGNQVCDSWLPFAFMVLSMTGAENQDIAWDAVVDYKSSSPGSTITNALWHIAVQAQLN